MHIAIVDDDPTLRISLKHFLHKWHTDNKLPLVMEEFDNGEDFINSMDEKNFDIVFMDIFMEKMDGIATANEMRKKSTDIILVFLTSSAEHMPDAFSVHAYGYLLKPLLPEKLIGIMDDIKNIMVEKDPEKEMELMIGKVPITVKFSDVICIQSDSNYCIVYCPKMCKIRGTFSEISKPLLEEEGFYVINRGIIVNFDHVKEMDSQNCIMDNGVMLPLNIKKSAQIRAVYQAYKFSN